MTEREIISIDEAIRHCYETCFERDDLCRECREEHKQLAKWLEELKESRNTINRQKAEIERLKKKANTPFAKITFDRDKLQEIVDEYVKNIEININLEKSEAIKEFAEEIEYFVLNEDIEVVEPKCKDYESYINGANQFRHQIKNGINNIIKEMTEVSE